MLYPTDESSRAPAVAATAAMRASSRTRFSCGREGSPLAPVGLCDDSRGKSAGSISLYRSEQEFKRISRIPNKTIYEKVKQTPLSNKLTKRQLAWVGHILRYDSNEPVRIYGLYEPSRQLCDKFGKVKAGKPKTSYVKYISGLISTKDISLSAEEIERNAQDRNAWKIMIEHADKYG